MRIVIGADHAGFRFETDSSRDDLRRQGHEMIDKGTDSADPVDYPDFAEAVSERAADGRRNAACWSAAAASARRFRPTRFPAFAPGFVTILIRRARASSMTT